MRRRQLTRDELAEVARLEQRIVEQDRLILKLEWPSLREGRTVAALTHRIGTDLVGFLGVYSFGGPPDAELTGMVDPAHRRRGIGGDLLERARAICAQEGLTDILVVVPRPSAGAARLVLARGGELEHSEYSMLLRGAPERVSENPAVTLRPVTDADVGGLNRLLTAGFGPPPEALLTHLDSDTAQTLMIDHAGEPVGTLRLRLDAGRGGVFGFTIAPPWRGQGIGRDVLGRACADLRERGAEAVELQVAVENDSALHLYTATGFEPISTEDYYRLP